MSAPVTDLLARRVQKRREALHFETPIEALAFCRSQVRELRDLRDSALLLDGREFDLPLSQVDAVLAACERLYDRPENQGAPDAGR